MLPMRFHKASHSTSSRDQVVAFLEANGLGTPQVKDVRFDMSEVGGNSQFDMFNSSMEIIGRQLGESVGDADYACVLEILLPPQRGSGIEVFGIHCFLLRSDGANAFSFLLNSHHQAFVDAKQYADNRYRNC